MTVAAPPREDIPSLTGVRFFAAASVVIAHALNSVPGSRDLDFGVTQPLTTLSGLGMSLFFVLSGFVIHYNYRESIRDNGASGLWRFFVARFARLYPLFFVMTLFDITTNGILARAIFGDVFTQDVLWTLSPLYLTLTQSWFYGIIDTDNYIYEFGKVAAVGWSISTEWFFYFAYPFVLAVVLLFDRLRWLVLLLVVVAVAWFLLIWCGMVYRGAIETYAARHYGVLATAAGSNQNSLFRWLVYMSPYSRIGEFIIGVLTCAIFQHVSRRPVSHGEERLGILLIIASLALLAFVHFMVLHPNRPYQILTVFHQSMGYALPVALLLFCVARYRNSFVRFLGSRALVSAGDVSYSLYLLHLLVIGFLSRVGLVALFPRTALGAWAAALFILAVSIAVSHVTYRLIEMPARTWFRKVLQTPPNLLQRGMPYRLLVGGSRAGVLVAMVLLPLTILVIRPPQLVLPPLEGTIDVVQASYGTNCGAQPGNASRRVVETCSGLKQCNYAVWAWILKDPAPGCGKTFEVQWRCSPDGAVETVVSKPGVGGKGETVTLQCKAAKTASAG